MLSVVYVSSATAPFSEAELVELLAHSREKNRRLDVTGMLLYHDGNFIQVLEGPAGAVQQLYDTIGADPRHRGVIRLLTRNIEEREFPESAMGFVNLNDPALRELPGYTEFLNQPLEKCDSGMAWRLLEVFRRNLRERGPAVT